MSTVKTNFVRFSGCCVALAVGLLSDKIAAPIAIAGLSGIIQGVAGNILSEKLGLFTNGVSEIFRKKHPSELNHDLQKLILSAIQMALKNIEILYLEENVEDEDKNTVKDFTKDIVTNLPIYFNATPDDENGQQIKRLLDSKTNSNDTLFHLMQLEMSNYQLSDFYKNFLETNISIQLQLCIAEKFKSEKDKKGWIAFQQLMFQEIKESIDSVLKGQESLHRDIQELKDNKIDSSISLNISDERVIKQVLEGLTFEKISLSFDKSLHDVLNNFGKQYEILLKNSLEHRKISEKNYNVSLETREYTIQNREGVKVLNNIVEKKLTGKKVAFLISISIALVFVIIWIFNYYDSAPFAANLILEIKDSEKPPELTNKIVAQIFLDEEVIESEVTNNQVKLFNIPGKYRDQLVKVSLKNLQFEPYKLYCDSCMIKLVPNKFIKLELIPYHLDSIKGFVISEDGYAVSDATISVKDIQAKTDSNGFFTISIPPEKQQRFQDITVFKKGYKLQTDSANPVYLNQQQNQMMRIVLNK